MSAAAALWGYPQESSQVVRFIFVDEGGISRHEPFVVVAGVVVHGDDQLVPLEHELERLMFKHIPRNQWFDFAFHAKDIWSGKGKVFGDRDKWPLRRRLDILRDLARVPRKLNIPIIYEAVERAKLDLSEIAKREGRDPTPTEHSNTAHAVAFTACTLRIEQQMHAKWPKEVAQIVAEDNDEVRATLKGVHAGLRDVARLGGTVPRDHILPLRRIRGSVHFARKTESKPLQLADLCAFAIRGHLARHPHNPPLYERIKPLMLLLPEGEVYRGPKLMASPPYLRAKE